MKNVQDLKKAGLELAKKYEGLTFEVKSKPYPESIAPHAKIVDSMRLLVHYKGCLFTSGHLMVGCSDGVFKMHIWDLEEELEYFDKNNEFKPHPEYQF